MNFSHMLFYRLKSLTLEERFETFSIKNGWLAIAFSKMYKRWCDTHDATFALLGEENKKSKFLSQYSMAEGKSSEKNNLEFGDLENHFYCRKKGSLSLSEKQISIDQAEKVRSFSNCLFNENFKDLIQSVKIYDDTEFYDTIILQEDLLLNIDRVINLFDTISEGCAFLKQCT